MSDSAFTYHRQAIRYQSRLQSRIVKIGEIVLGAGSPIKIQTMTTTDTMDTEATVAEVIRCVQAGAELVRITTPSIKEAKNLQEIKNSLRARGYKIPLVADVHFTAKAAEIAAEIVEKVRINPGNYVEKKGSQEYNDAEYQTELERIYLRLCPLLKICKKNSTALRIGVNHGSLSERIMMRYGDNPIGMVESAMEFLRMTRAENFHNVVLSMKSSNPIVMVQAYRLLVEQMLQEFQESYPLHLGVTEAGDALSGRVKSATGIGTLLAEGIGDTIRVSLTEDPEFELPIATLLARKFQIPSPQFPESKISYNPSNYRRQSPPEYPHLPLGAKYPPLVLSDAYGLLQEHKIRTELSLVDFDFTPFGYTKLSSQANYYQQSNIATDFLILPEVPAQTPPTLKFIIPYSVWQSKYAQDKRIFPLCNLENLSSLATHTQLANTHLFIRVDISQPEKWERILGTLTNPENASKLEQSLLIAHSEVDNSALIFRNFALYLQAHKIQLPLIFSYTSKGQNEDQLSVDLASTVGGILIDGIGAGLCLTQKSNSSDYSSTATLLELSFAILQCVRLRISSTDYISCPSCGRTLFDLQSVTQKIKQATKHLRGVKIGIMGCIVNGPGEMADADFGYVGSGKNKINLYKGQEIVRRNVDSDIAVGALIALIKEYGMWNEP